jgi:hypothetical protein
VGKTGAYFGVQDVKQDIHADVRHKTFVVIVHSKALQGLEQGLWYAVDRL